MRTAYEIVKAHYDANARRDMDGMLADIAADCRWTEMDGFPCAGTYVGPQEVFKNVFFALGEAFDGYTFGLERLLDAGSDVIGIGDYAGTYRQTGKSFKARVVHVWSVADGKIRRFEQFTDTLRVADAMR
ncbi:MULTISPECIES: nuclear transport factor 2 family protein [Rhizobium]|uniref:nuclear transport factor 2 family protein n=1 Tax=Rhizobium TaxID=379 RepID=UPI000DE43EFB|nr:MULTISPECIES: nuclear transport factor 2 family protein [Rhizobium]MBY2910485.1 nuclear transport factor 2 family protein [Rhizobium leguminosarum]MBY2937615.1 nuclear transport factor 2 family protein [Rhizobium leguminosarum]MBY2944962.1 nuclear transport factor 2 family protein [Rhizobium leguminosarum]MBY2950271.1 nuclear transport factor 2 family protein [Rhizobium leguminosarum]MBY2967626.1 nuclear transport factor 2 family protein [Rhizobium leguminosarum]